MTLLTLAGVSVRFRSATALADVSLEVAAGELVIVWGPARSGRTTLLEVASGVRPPDVGTVTFAGRAPGASLGRQGGFALVTGSSRALLGHDDLVIDQVAYPAIRTMSRWRAQAAADGVLRRCGVEELAQEPIDALSAAERIRVLLARSLVREPRLVLLDEPTTGLSHPESERFLELVRSLVRDDGLAVLMTDDAEGAALVPGARVLTMQRGTVRGAGPSVPADVIPLDGRRAGPGRGL
ncbi:branched-chain amino acid transport system ATP-binding protein [Conexibacter arvalis]|uniref:Branched-chain amino acid transport system ATP-binding protein n=1 Tax=Conexibacter arvalis TaxID=912552 RepID=A0A840IHL2_9ACTN|nr:branched-chain amino acid transport system ATP-binding protein [Conexibacter arvalis]